MKKEKPTEPLKRLQGTSGDRPNPTQSRINLDKVAQCLVQLNVKSPKTETT